MYSVSDLDWLFKQKPVASTLEMNDLFLFDIWERVHVGRFFSQYFLLEGVLAVKHQTRTFVSANLFPAEDVVSVLGDCLQV